MIGGTTSPILQPLRTIAGAGGGGSDNASAGDGTTTTAANSDSRHPRRTTTTEEGATTTTRASHTTTTASGATTTTPVGGTVPPSPIGNCKTSDLAYTTNTSKTSYRPNGPVDISIAVRNTSSRPCYAPAPCGIAAWASVEDTSGATVWKNSPASTPCPNPPPSSPLLNPNDSHNYGGVATWNQVVCPDGDGCSGPHAPAGTYRAVARRGTATAAGVTFALRV